MGSGVEDVGKKAHETCKAEGKGPSKDVFDGLTALERAYVHFVVWIHRSNHTQAAIAAGYSKKSAKQSAYKLDNKPRVRLAIEAEEKRRRDEIKDTVEGFDAVKGKRLLKALICSLAPRVGLGEFVPEGLGGLARTDTDTVDGLDDGEEACVRGDLLKAIDKLFKTEGFYRDVHDHRHTVGDIRDLSDAELEQRMRDLARMLGYNLVREGQH